MDLVSYNGGRRSKCRGRRNTSTEAAARPADPITAFRALSKRAQTGDQAALIDLRALMIDQPRLIELFGDVGRMARQAWVKFIAGEDFGVQNAMLLKSDQIIEMFAGSGASAIERLLAEQIATAWLRLSALTLNETVETKQWGNQTGDYLLKRHDQAMRQFYESIRQLGEYRTMIGRIVTIEDR